MNDFNEGVAVKPLFEISKRSFTEYHQELLDIVFGKSKLDEKVVPVSDPRCLNYDDLHRLAYMTKLEFAASLSQELQRDDDVDSTGLNEEPHAFDVFRMKKELARGNQDLAVCLPMNKPKEYPLMWHDANGNFWPMDGCPPTHIRKVASLSSSARILENLLANHGNMLMAAAMSRECIEEVQINIELGMAFHLNESQAQAVAALVNPEFRTGFLVIQGPPGTGKTSTMVEMVHAVGNSIIVVAPSNAAIANIALKVYSTMKYNLGELSVYGENCHESIQFLSHVHRGRKYQEFRKAFDNLPNDTDKEKLKRGFAHWLHQDPNSFMIESIAMACPFIEMKKQPGRSFLKEMIGKSKVVFCTLNTAGSPFLRTAFRKRFHTLLLDEGGQCSEAEFYIAATVPGVKRIVVMGDPLQLPATVIEPMNQAAGYGDSWMGQIHKYHRRKVHLLDTQYRMDPAILFFPNKHFYSGQIRSGENVYGRTPHVEQPLQFIDTAGSGEQEKDGFSWKNSYESAVIKSIIKSDPDIKRIRTKNRDAKIIVITPYKAQTELLMSQFRNVKGLQVADVATVDSYQGMEADIVIISTVRTNGVGFVDNSQRLNVALTRAIRVLRIVGDAQFFLSLPTGSTLKKIALHGMSECCMEKSKLNALAWRSPNWNVPLQWKVLLTQRFHHVVRKMPENIKNICFNTLLALAAPNSLALYALPVPQTNPCWQTSSLKGYQDILQVVWLAKPGSIEGHFAGTRVQCCRFVSMTKLSAGACIISRTLGAIYLPETRTPEAGKVNNVPCLVWKMSNNIQSSFSLLKSLPHGSFCLDDYQSTIMTAVPPLIIESRSGTGKTNVLFQHAIAYTPASRMPICFITVSSRLAKELKDRFEEVSVVEGACIPSVVFYSFNAFIQDLLQTIGDHVRDVTKMCNFRSYSIARKSHIKLAIEATVMENEIGGVILGSLAAARQKHPLSLAQYMDEKRSNIDGSSKEGQGQRLAVYEEYLRYRSWKIENNLFDINDIVLKILQADLGAFFESVYLDEVQDFSYASIFLILSIAGKTNTQWICAGDTAQMISPGCSFTFDGLKQTMLAIQPGIESKLSKVFHLLRNYRTTKDVLEVGNTILDVAKQHFPQSIEYAQPEVAMKDLYLKVFLCSWDDCFRLHLSMGSDQAFIFSSNGNTDELEKKANLWLKNHPFVVSSLESKGLEFDDVIIAFEHERKVWNVATRNAASLRMLRELYVAVTRAKRRVVILVKPSNASMVEFFTSGLNCSLEFAEPDSVMQEFDRETSHENWYEKGMAFFQDEKFKLAMSCFSAAQEFGWSFWAQGLHQISTGQKEGAVSALRSSSRHFFSANDFKRTLDIFQVMKDLPPWNSDDDIFFETARAMVPGYFSRPEMVKFALVREVWADVKIHDLWDSATAPLLYAYRTHDFLKALVDKSSIDEISLIELVFPLAIADWCLRKVNKPRAVKLYLVAGDRARAGEITVDIATTFDVGSSEADLLDTISFWNGQHDPVVLNEIRVLDLLLSLFTAPLTTSNQFSRSCMTDLGPHVIKCAVRHNGLDDSCLHSFHTTAFAKDVTSSLEKKYGRGQLQIVRWFCTQEDEHNATEYIAKHLKELNDCEIFDIVVKELNLRPSGIFRELEHRGMLLRAISMFLQMNPPDLDGAVEGSRLALDATHRVAKNFHNLAAIWSLEEHKREACKLLTRDKSSNVALMLGLVLGDIESLLGTDFPRNCYATFGRHIVYQFILQRGPWKTDLASILSMFDRNAFRSVNSFEIMQDLAKYGSSEKARLYAIQKVKQWSDVELNKIVFNLNHRSIEIQNELEARNMFHDLVKLTVDEGKFSVAEYFSNRALLCSSDIFDSVIQLLQVWSTCQDNGEHFLFSVARDGCGMSNLWILWKRPWNLTVSTRSDLGIRLGPIIVRTIAQGNLQIDFGPLKGHYHELNKILKSKLPENHGHHSLAMNALPGKKLRKENQILEPDRKVNGHSMEKQNTRLVESNNHLSIQTSDDMHVDVNIRASANGKAGAAMAIAPMEKPLSKNATRQKKKKKTKKKNAKRKK